MPLSNAPRTLETTTLFDIAVEAAREIKAAPRIVPPAIKDKMNSFAYTTIAVVMLGTLSCTQNQRPGDRSEPAPKPYTIQRDALGESLNSFVANNPSCKPKPDVVANSQICVVKDQTTYAGMPLLGRTARFYEDRLYEISLIAPTKACRQFDLLGSLKQTFGEPKNTKTVDGKEITPAGGFKIWQNSVSTITFAESMGSLDACTTIFQVDAVYWNVWKLEQEEEGKTRSIEEKGYVASCGCSSF